MSAATPEPVLLGRPRWERAGERCSCGALRCDHLATFEGRCYLVKNERTLRMAGVRTLSGQAVRR